MLLIRLAGVDDIPSIVQLSSKVYTKDAYSKAELLGQINNFSEGQFVAEMDGKIVGYCASMMIPERLALKKHSWREVTGNGYCSTHNPKGDYLYGVDIFVDPNYRKMRIGERFYRERMKLCKRLHLKGIIIGGRMPLFRKKIKTVKTPKEYVEAVLNKKVRDPVINFQLRQGFEILGILENYLPTDSDSMGYAVHMIWKNPHSTANADVIKKSSNISNTIRVASVQYMQRKINSFEEFKTIITHFVDVVHSYRCDFVLFPEMFTLQLLSIHHKKLIPKQLQDLVFGKEKVPAVERS